MTETTTEMATETAETIDPSAVIESFTGWDEIAIEQAFKMSFARMGRSTMALRSVQFVINRRAGMDDKAAFRDAMSTTFGVLNERYAASDTETGDEESGEA